MMRLIRIITYFMAADMYLEIYLWINKTTAGRRSL